MSLILKNSSEETIFSLLSQTLDWPNLIFDLEEFACFRGYLPGMHEHHIEPERERTIYLWPLEHLAIHICHAKLYSSGKHHAQVSAFVKPYPGRYNHLLHVSEPLKEKILSFGQKRPETSYDSIAHARSFIDREKQIRAVTESGKKNKGRKCTWGDKVSETIKKTPMVTCEFCGREMQNIGGNLIQHQRSSKCLK